MTYAGLFSAAVCMWVQHASPSLTSLINTKEESHASWAIMGFAAASHCAGEV